MKLKYILIVIAVLIPVILGCPIYNVFGVQCPACGVTRAWVSFFSGDIISAVRFHALFWLVPIPIIAFAVHDIPVFRKFNKIADSVGVVSGAVIAVYHIIRMFL